MSDPVIQLWASQPVTPVAIDTSDMAARADRLASRIRCRDAIEYAASAMVVVAFGWIGYAFDDALFRIACTAIIFGTLIVIRNLWVRRVRSDPALLGQASHIHYRAELVRQRDSLASVWRWYLGPFVPGLLLFQFAIWRLTAPATGPMAATIGLLPTALPIFAIFIGIHWLNRIAARRMTRLIEALDREIDPLNSIIKGE